MNAARKIADLTIEEFIELIRSERERPAEPKPIDTYVDSEAIQKHFGISRATVHNWVHEEGCPYEQRGKILRFKLSSVESWFAGRTQPLKRVR